ncbi:MAG: hypothetical protein Q4G42_00010 [Neisseria sp.]|nr:hypothetical protein [Neisseria sp.]
MLAVLSLTACSKASDIPVRQQYWEKEMAAGLKDGASRAELEAFFGARGQALRCYSSYENAYKRGTGNDRCSMTDMSSRGGFDNLPTYLIIIFTMKDGRSISREISSTTAPDIDLNNM